LYQEKVLDCLREVVVSVITETHSSSPSRVLLEMKVIRPEAAQSQERKGAKERPEEEYRKWMKI